LSYIVDYKLVVKERSLN